MPFHPSERWAHVSGAVHPPPITGVYLPIARAVCCARMLVILPFAWRSSGTAEATPNSRRVRDRDRLSMYFRCITAALASYRRWNPSIRLALVTDRRPEVAVARELAALGVEVNLIDFDHDPPARFAPQFRTSLFALDALEAAWADDRWGHLVVTDPDSLCMEPIDSLIDLADGNIGGYVLDYPPDHNINGLTRREAARIYAELEGKNITTYPSHFGGELIVIPRSCLPAVLERAEAAWRDALTRFELGLPHFVTEEHVLSYAFHGLPVTDISPKVRRIWTAAGYRRVVGDEACLSIWHLPAEKARGFTDLYRAAVDQGSWWWREDEASFRREVGRLVGVPHRRALRFARDAAYRPLLGVRRGFRRSAE